jgi:hypothetical protein
VLAGADMGALECRLQSFFCRPRSRGSSSGQQLVWASVVRRGDNLDGYWWESAIRDKSWKHLDNGIEETQHSFNVLDTISYDLSAAAFKFHG